MGERTSYTPGTFSWVDLTTTDQAAAKDFYAALLGWEMTDFPVGDGVTYTMAGVGGRHVGAISPQQPQQAAAGVPPTWNSYVTVLDVDASAARAAELGATVHAPPFDVMTAGRMAVIQDPQGAHFVLWEARDNHGAGLVNAHGALSWNELATPDIDGASSFYSDLLGWEVQPLEGMPMAYSVIKTASGGTNGGIRVGTPDEGPPNWLVYFGADDINATLEKAKELGATQLSDVFDMGSGRFAAVRDPSGAVFALYSGEFED